MPSRYNLPHLDIAAFKSEHKYTGEGAFGDPAARDRAVHGQKLRAELAASLAAARELRPADPRLEPATGSYIEVELRRGTPADTLTATRAKIRTGAVNLSPTNERIIALFVPDEAQPVLDRILEDYLNGQLTDAGNPPNRAKVECIEAIRTARLETFWTDDRRALPADAQAVMWWALWCYKDREAKIEDVCARLDLRVAGRDRRLYFPEVSVVPVYASRAAIELLLYATDAVAELRRANDTPTFFTDEIEGDIQEWVDSLASRVTWPGADVPAVCLFDTGVNRGHPLIEPALAPADMLALDPEWGVDDQGRFSHGTPMAGLALHGDLTGPLSDTAPRVLTHRLESVKLLPPQGFPATQVRNLGVLTQAAVAFPEIGAPKRRRVYCMAITNKEVSGEHASGWSAAIDQAAAGRMIADDVALGGDADRPHRLIVVSAGNRPAETDPLFLRSPDECPIEDPAQAWNALTIGGCTDLDEVSEVGYEAWQPLASVGDLSPHSRTSVTWKQGIAPFKPELVMEAGNRAMNPSGTEVLTFGSLSLLTTGRDTSQAPLVSFDATSAATAQAARMAAQLSAEYPDYWPEMIRALMIHSAEWTAPMQAAITGTTSKRARYQLIRQFGYGVPDLDRARASARNHLALFAQAEIQPFTRVERKFNHCHYYQLPIPDRMLEELDNEPVELKLTLSYFVDPNPGLSANVDPQRYQSHGLRFDLQRRNESFERFRHRVNVAERDGAARPVNEAADWRWTLGDDSVSAGSLHSDTWTGPAIELLRRKALCIKPVNGWWRQRASPEVCNRKTRYALIVTLKARNASLDIYTPIKTAIETPLSVETDIFG